MESQPFERVSTTFELGTPDRVPVLPLVTYALSKLYGYTINEFTHNGKKLAKITIRGYEDFKYDAVIAFADVYVFAEATGVTLDFSQEVPKPIHFPVKTIEDVERLEIPDPKRDGRLPVLLEAIRLLSKKFQDKVPIYSGGQGPFSLSAEIVGLEKFLMDIYRNPELVEKMLRFSTEYMIEVGRAEYDAGAHIIHLGESFAGPSLISPKNFTKLALPYNREVFTKWRSLGAYTSIHICGDSKPIWDMIPETKTHNFEIDHVVDIGKAKKFFEGKIAIMGNVDPSAVLYHGTTKDVENACRKCIESAGKGGGYILSSGCLIMPGFPIENLHTMVKTAKKYNN